MNSLTCNTNSSRAIKARTARYFDNKLIRQILWVITLGLIAAWLYVVFVTHSTVGNLLIGISGILLMLLLWYYGELKDLKPAVELRTATDISGVLDRKVLAQLKGRLTPKTLAKVVSKQEGGYFYGARFGIGSNFLVDLSVDDELALNTVWAHALDIASSNQADEINSGTLACALILSIPQVTTYLGHLSLDEKDILDGVEWLGHMQAVIARHSEKHNVGGIGRDLSFGWAPTLNHIGFNITDSLQNGGILRRPVGSRGQTIDQVLHVLSQPGRRNAVLVGDVGVGKTTLAYSVAQRLISQPKDIPPELRFQQIIALDAAHLIANAKSKGQLEELLIHVFNEALSAKNVILFLDEAQLFLKDATGSVDLSNILLPVLEGGALKIILALDQQEWLKLSQTNPGLAQLLNRVIVKPLDISDTIQVIEDETLVLEAKHKVVFMHQSIKEACKLADRYIHDQAFPGKALKLLEAAAGFPEQKHFVTAKSVQQAAEKSFDVKVQTASTADEQQTLLNLEDKIHRRMINQTRAVKLVSDALRRARTGVRNQNKPIGSFLFLGPTGVGKTELSKALADVYFGGEDRMVRVDLNEFSHADDTNRLIAIGATDPFSLCAQIAKQPFSVVLLDEIEKAHPNVLNLLLQMLDEGTLRDAANKPISFRDAIIIATSNAGADKIRAHIEHGEKLEQFEEQFVNELINQNIFRPEFLNRFDEIILFRPLEKDELLQVVDLLIAGVNKSLADRKVAVSLTAEAKQLLVDRGYDPRLGARPLRRVVQRAVENVVAQKLLSNQVIPGQTVQLGAEELAQTLQDRQ